MAVSNSVAAITEGAAEVKTTSYPLGVAATEKIAKVIADKGDVCDATCTVNTASIKRTISQVERICEQGRAKNSMLNAGFGDTDEMMLTVNDSESAVAECVAKLGYDLSDDDLGLVYEAFVRIASKKDSISGRELDSIVASTALQVPPTYTLERYVINSGNVIKATATICIDKNGEKIEKVAVGDGPIDAAFAAVEEITGKRYELDDWKMQAVTEGQEAMGEAIVKIMNDGKVYSGRGISTDIVGSSIRAYLNALNKIVYEEEN
jgi:2-isopropylmalate synthase